MEIFLPYCILFYLTKIDPCSLSHLLGCSSISFYLLWFRIWRSSYETRLCNRFAQGVIKYYIINAEVFCETLL